MSDYKIVRDATGAMVCYGPNTDSYEPTLKDGEVLTIESEAVASALIKDSEIKAEDTSATNRASGIAHAKSLGFTQAQAEAMFP